MKNNDNNSECVIQNLIDAGCSKNCIENFIRSGENGMTGEQICQLKDHRQKLLDNIHTYQKKLDCLDYLIYLLKNK